MFLALREIRHEPLRFALIVSVVALVAYLAFFLASLAMGLAHLYRAGIDGWGAGSIVVTDASNESIPASRLSDEQVDAARELAGSRGTTAATLISAPAVAQAATADDGVLRDDIFVFGVDPDGGRAQTPGRIETYDGGYAAYVLARAERARQAAVAADESLRAEGLDAGDTIRLLGSDHDWTIVGFTRDTTFQAAPVVTLDADALRRHAPAAPPPAASAVVYGADLSADADALERARDAGLSIFTSEQIIRSLPGYSAQILTFSLMIGSLVLIASTVLGIFIYVLTLQKRPVIGILKARGVPTGYLAGSGCAQTLVLSGAGIAIGSLLALGTSLLLPGTVPFRSSGPLYALIAIAFVAVSVAGGLISVRAVARIDPVEAVS